MPPVVEQQQDVADGEASRSPPFPFLCVAVARTVLRRASSASDPFNDPVKDACPTGLDAATWNRWLVFAEKCCAEETSFQCAAVVHAPGVAKDHSWHHPDCRYQPFVYLVWASLVWVRGKPGAVAVAFALVVHAADADQGQRAHFHLLRKLLNYVPPRFRRCTGYYPAGLRGGVACALVELNDEHDRDCTYDVGSSTTSAGDLHHAEDALRFQGLTCFSALFRAQAVCLQVDGARPRCEGRWRTAAKARDACPADPLNNLFWFVVESRVTCTGAGHCHGYFEPAYLWMAQAPSSRRGAGPAVSLQDALMSCDLLERENQWWCSSCDAGVDATKTMCLAPGQTPPACFVAGLGSRRHTAQGPMLMGTKVKQPYLIAIFARFHLCSSRNSYSF